MAASRRASRAGRAGQETLAISSHPSRNDVSKSRAARRRRCRDIRNGTYETNAGATWFNSHVVMPLDREAIEATVESACALAEALDVGAGFVAVEPTFGNAESVALGRTLPLARPGLSERRRVERRGRDWHVWEPAELLAGPEWGTFLGARHLEELDLDVVRASGAFDGVVRISPRLAFLQVTAEPDADGRDGFEQRLVDARAALAPILMDLSDVDLESP
ncbi:MAG: hypothetical protein KIT31_33170 [Deltaproteobacteria bacterium]|nr:hypothetical protein [Deltaproteobacteria bacterium]